MTQEAFIYEALRTPRGKGSRNGSLHEVRPVSLVKGLLEEMFLSQLSSWPVASH